MIVAVSAMVVLAVNDKIAPVFLTLARSAQSKETILAEKLIDLDNDGQFEKVIKTKRKGSLSVQVYRLLAVRDALHSELWGQYDLPASEEGFIYYKTAITNLAFSDINHDGRLEIIVSLFDREARKSTYHALAWDPVQKTLRRVKEE
ncbi:MAG: hypothetical protein HYY62_08360 [Deltaproteobacteria bacterium]|nr:hypothetical protein [Deltaproteobacteria bacterium]